VVLQSLAGRDDPDCNKLRALVESMAGSWEAPIPHHPDWNLRP
jgi:hypothetical protein